MVARLAAHVHQDQRDAAQSGDFGETGIVFEAGDVIDDFGAGSDGDFGDAGFAGVDRDGDFQFAAEGLENWEEPAEFFDDAEVPVEPGRVDSAPTSRMSAPAFCSERACAMARSAVRNLLPSEKLSGVTFRTPMISVRLPSVSVRAGSWRRKTLRVMAIGGMSLAREGEKQEDQVN